MRLTHLSRKADGFSRDLRAAESGCTCNYFLLTRFDARPRWREHYVGTHDSWLQPRMELIVKYSLASVQVQWASLVSLVFFDKDTPRRFTQQLASKTRRKILVQVYVEGDLRDVDIAREVARWLGPATDTLVTTRLDNDDGIRGDYLMRV